MRTKHIAVTLIVTVAFAWLFLGTINVNAQGGGTVYLPVAVYKVERGYTPTLPPTATATSTPEPTTTPYPTHTPHPTYTPEATYTPQTSTPTPVTTSPVPDGAITPNDTYYSTYQWALQKIRAPEAWSISTGQDVVIAIVDTGVDVNHSDLSGRFVHPSLWRNFAEGGTDVTDTNGHGTHVTGIAAAATNNLLGVAGVNWGAKVLPLKVFGDNGTGSVSWIADAIRYAADNGARVINLSLGNLTYSDALQSQINYARSRGALVIAAAGNCAQGGSKCGNLQNPPTYPAAMAGVVAVAATTIYDTHAPYSSYGAYVDIAAPGGTAESIYTLIASTYPGNEYAAIAGTSMAAPHVSGLAALILGLHPSMTPDEVESIITSTSSDLGATGHDPYFGHGRIDMRRALETAWRWQSSVIAQRMPSGSQQARGSAKRRPAIDCTVPHDPERILVRTRMVKKMLRDAGLSPASPRIVKELGDWQVLPVAGTPCEAVQALNRAAGERVAELDLIVTLPEPEGKGSD